MTRFVASSTATDAPRPDTPAGFKLHKLIRKWRRHLFVFVTNRALAATNNGSERVLLPAAV